MVGLLGVRRGPLDGGGVVRQAGFRLLGGTGDIEEGGIRASGPHPSTRRRGAKSGGVHVDRDVLAVQGVDGGLEFRDGGDRVPVGGSEIFRRSYGSRKGRDVLRGVSDELFSDLWEVDRSPP
jgi:hypothetical protein